MSGAASPREARWLLSCGSQCKSNRAERVATGESVPNGAGPARPEGLSETSSPGHGGEIHRTGVHSRGMRRIDDYTHTTQHDSSLGHFLPPPRAPPPSPLLLPCVVILPTLPCFGHRTRSMQRPGPRCGQGCVVTGTAPCEPAPAPAPHRRGRVRTTGAPHPPLPFGFRGCA